MARDRYWRFSRIERAATLLLVVIIAALIYLFYVRRADGGESYSVSEQSCRVDSFMQSLEEKPAEELNATNTKKSTTKSATKAKSTKKAKVKEEPVYQVLSPKLKDSGN